MQYFIALILALFLTFSACNKKASPKISTASTSISHDRPSIVPVPVMSAEVMVEAPSPVIAMEAIVSPSPVPSVRSEVSRDEKFPIKSETSTPYQQEIQSGILTAADIDDNLNLKYFQKYVNKILQSKQENIFPFMNTKDRVKLTIVDKQKKGLNRIKVKIANFTGYTNSAGIIYIFPSLDNIPLQTTLEINGKSKPIDLSSKKEFNITFNKPQVLPKSLDLMFVIDSTGSMGDEMAYLTKEFDAIISNVEEKHPNVNIRFGLTLYRDKGDDYVVKSFDFTSDKNKMKEQLKKQSANGGGDYPEVMDEGIEKALKASWKAKDGVKMMFIVADAPPHDDKIKQMIPLIQKAREMDIHIYPLGASGVAQKAEYMMRHLALFTSGRYLWLTDDSGVGNSHAEPKVNCYQVSRLDQLISRVIQSELSGQRIEAKQGDILRRVGTYQNGICQ